VIEPLAYREFTLQDPPAPPAAPAGGQGQQGPPGWTTLLPFVAIFVIFYFLLIRPQRKQQKQREEMISNLKKNDHVITSGGLCGVVDRIKDNDVYLKVDERADVRLRVLRTAIVAVEKASATPEDGAPDAAPVGEKSKK
jgi:preprotein translocase subunit YajC